MGEITPPKWRKRGEPHGWQWKLNFFWIKDVQVACQNWVVLPPKCCCSSVPAGTSITWEASYGIYRLQRGLLGNHFQSYKNAHVWKVVLPNFPSCWCPTLTLLRLGKMRASIAHLLITKHNPGDMFDGLLYLEPWLNCFTMDSEG